MSERCNHCGTSGERTNLRRVNDVLGRSGIPDSAVRCGTCQQELIERLRPVAEELRAEYKTCKTWEDAARSVATEEKRGKTDNRPGLAERVRRASASFDRYMAGANLMGPEG